MDHLRASLLAAEMRPVDAAASDLSKSREAPAHRSLPLSRRGPVTPAAGSERGQIFAAAGDGKNLGVGEGSGPFVFFYTWAHGAKRTPGRCFGHV